MLRWSKGLFEHCRKSAFWLTWQWASCGAGFALVWGKSQSNNVKKLCSIKPSDKHGHYMLKMIHVFPKIWKEPGYTLKTKIMTRFTFLGELTVWNRNTPIYFVNTCYRSYCEWLIHACVFLFLQLIKMSQLDLPVKTKDFSMVIYAMTCSLLKSHPCKLSFICLHF